MNRAREFTVNRRRAMLLLKLTLTEIEELQRELEAYENAQPLTAAFVVGCPSRDAFATDDDNGAAVERWRYL